LASRQSGETFRFSPNEEIRPHALKELLKDKLTNEVTVSAPVSYGETPEDHYQRGLRYVNGTTPNYDEAAKWFTLAAEAGHPAAQKSLGYLYASGKGVVEDYAEAQKWFRKASAQGNTEASLAGTLASLVKTNALPLSAEPETPQPQRASTPQDYYERGLRYANGDGVTQDYAEAAKWYRLAADAGNTAAQRSLGYLYGSGKGVPQDYAEAQKWFQKASSRGDADAGLVSAVTAIASTNRDSTATNVAPAGKKSDNSK
jgi:TPR repeat protein